MRGNLALFIFLVGLLPWSPAHADETAMSRIFPYPTHVKTLDNGLKVILVPMSSGGLVSYWSIVRTGARDEYEAGHTGFAHFFEHMMFRGTEKFPQDVYNQVVTEMGADANAFTSDDLTAYHLSLTAGDLEKVMEVESDRFQRLSYKESAFKTEAGAVYGEYRKNRTSPFFTIYEAIHQAAYDTHTYGHTAMGYEQDIQAMPTMYEYSRTFFSRYYRPENIVLFIAGDIQVDRTMELIRHYYREWEPGYVTPEVSPEPVQKAERRIDVPYEGSSLPILWIAYKADRFDPTDRNMVAADLLTELAFGETSDIYKKLVLDEQVVEFLSAGVNMNRDPGLLDIFTRIKEPDRVDYVLKEIDSVVALYQEFLPETKRLADLKARLKYDFLMNLDTPDHVASNLARLVAVTGGIQAVNDLYTTYESITPEDVRGSAKKFLSPDQRTIGVLRGDK